MLKLQERLKNGYYNGDDFVCPEWVKMPDVLKMKASDMTREQFAEAAAAKEAFDAEKDRYKVEKQAYHEAMALRGREFGNDLFDAHPDLKGHEKLAGALFGVAWAQSHSYGYGEVAGTFSSLVDDLLPTIFLNYELRPEPKG